MFERFTEGARQTVVLAQEEARALKHGYIGTEHLLLGLLAEEEGIAARVLADLGFDREQVRVDVARIVGHGPEVIAHGQMPFTPRTKKVFELSLRDALSLGDNHIGTEHLLLALVGEGDGVAARILRDGGSDAAEVREAVTGALAAAGYEKHMSGGAAAARPDGPRLVRPRASSRAPTPAPTPASFAQALARALERAATAAGARPIDVGDLLVALLAQPDGVVAAAVANGDLDVDALRAAIDAARERAG